MMTNSLFVDTSGWFTLVDPKDVHYALAEQVFRTTYIDQSIAIYTTDHVIAELVPLLAARKIARPQIVTRVDEIILDSRITKLFTDQPLFLDAWAFLKSRPDKEWSLADAISIVQMQRLGITEALTNDHHFEQAGLIRLLK